MFTALKHEIFSRERMHPKEYTQRCSAKGFGSLKTSPFDRSAAVSPYSARCTGPSHSPLQNRPGIDREV
jgi:hypothetical protein